MLTLLQAAHTSGPTERFLEIGQEGPDYIDCIISAAGSR